MFKGQKRLTSIYPADGDLLITLVVCEPSGVCVTCDHMRGRLITEILPPVASEEDASALAVRYHGRGADARSQAGNQRTLHPNVIRRQAEAAKLDATHNALYSET